MAYLAPGQRRRTAWARTCAVEWRSTSRPASESAVTMATWAPSGSGNSRSTSRPSTVARTAALARREPMDWASSRPVVPSASSRVEPSGRPTEMTPGIVRPFLLSRRIVPGPDSVRGPPRVLDGPRGPGPPGAPGRARRPAPRSERDAEEPCPVGNRPPGGRLVVERAQRGGRVEVVVEGGPHGGHAAARPASSPARSGALRHSASRDAAAGMSSSVRQSQS